MSERKLVEEPIIKELQGLGWKYIKHNEMSELRNRNFEEPLVIRSLKRSLKRINRGIELTDEDIDLAISSLRTIPATMEGSERFLEVLRNGLVIPLKEEGKEKPIKILDLENPDNNEYIVTNQFRVEGSEGPPIRADVAIIVNGIPLALIEAKSSTGEENWLDAYKDIKIYEKSAPELFKYIQFSIATDRNETRYFPNFFMDEEEDLISEWKDPYPRDREEFEDDVFRMTIHGLLSKRNLLDLIKNFIFVRKKEGESAKIMPRYMQFRASNRIFDRVVNTLKGEKSEKFGLVWHWQGSGKTYTMAFSAWKLLYSKETENPTIFVMVDMKDLEGQIEKDFSFLGVPIERIRSIRKLAEKLEWGGEGKRGIFLVTIEKFSPKEFTKLEREGFEPEVKRENVVVLADEVHRTQYGKFATIMRSILKNAFIFGFTGTPLSKPERNTFQKFCPKGELYLDRYSMLDALNDGFTVRISYQARFPDKFHLNKQQLEGLAKFEEEEIEKLSPRERRELKKEVRPIKTIIKKAERIDEISKDISKHFKEVVEPSGLKAMIVAADREACVKYKRAIDERLPSDYSEVVMTMSFKEKIESIREYFEEMQEDYGTSDLKQIHEEIIDNFNRGDKPKILIVTDMLITGFDSPGLWTMYLDKPLKEHRLLQTIARTDRPLSNKKFGLILDYIGVFRELEEAFEKFEAKDLSGLKTVIRDLSEEERVFEELMNDTLGIFEGIKRTTENIKDAVEILSDPEKSRKFERSVKKLKKSYEMLSGEPFLRDYLPDYEWIIKVYIAYYKRYKKKLVDELKIDKLSKKTHKLIQESVDIADIADMYPIVGIDEDYLEDLRKSAPKGVAAAMDIAGSIEHEIEQNVDSPFLMSLREYARSAYEELINKQIETKEAIVRLTDICEEIVGWKEERGKMGKDIHNIYEAVRDILPDFESSQAINFANSLLSDLRESNLLFNGWQEQRGIWHRIKIESRIKILSDFKDYQNKVDDLAEAVFDALWRVER